MKNAIFLLSIGIIIGSGCQPTQKMGELTSGAIIKQGYINCFEEGELNEKGELLNCEASAAVYFEGGLTLANDKVVPSRPSSFFKMPFDDIPNDRAITYLKGETYTATRKIEDFSISPKKDVIIAIAAFDRFSETDLEFQLYNTIIYWQPNQEAGVKVANPVSEKGQITSKGLRTPIFEALVGKNSDEKYLKIEGLAILPNNRLLIGIREVGTSYKDFNYVVKILETTYTFENEILEVNPAFKLVYDFNPTKLTDLNLPVGLSSIEYDPFNNQIYLLTSYEHGESDEQVGAYLWRLSIKDFEGNQPPTLVRKADGQPLLFSHKGEAVTVIDKQTVLVIHDDDRILGRIEVLQPEIQFCRQPFQAAYSIVRFK